MVPTVRWETETDRDRDRDRQEQADKPREAQGSTPGELRGLDSTTSTEQAVRQKDRDRDRDRQRETGASRQTSQERPKDPPLENCPSVAPLRGLVSTTSNRACS